MSVNQPLADRMRPKGLDGYLGQGHLVGKNAILRLAIESGNMPSFILWGPPGVGKTTLARIIANSLDRPFFSLSAVHSGVKEVREAIEKARSQKLFDSGNAILFIDEIHRFNKAQQDSLLASVESGVITLIGATTENPSFEIITPLLSRCQVYILKPLNGMDMEQLLMRAIAEDVELKKLKINLLDTGTIIGYSGGDARKLLNILELVIYASLRPDGSVEITGEQVKDCIRNNLALYDKGGEQHYDVVSAFIKSVRGSDPNGAVYWLARMVEGGEDPKFIARRLVILAAEDIGLANPNALLMATSCFNAVNLIGWPESRIILSEAAIYLAASPKSNSAYIAINRAQELVRENPSLPVPLHLRNAPTGLMKELGYGSDYKYAHDYEGNFTEQLFLPDGLTGTSLYECAGNAKEKEMKERLEKLWKGVYRF